MASVEEIDDELEPVFRALADRGRRRILDLLKRNPGSTVGEICERFEYTRFAVMKHLGVLEDANLISRLRDGRSKTPLLKSHSATNAAGSLALGIQPSVGRGS